MPQHTSLNLPQSDVGDLLLFNHIPFAEDLRAYQFAPLPTPNSHATNAALQLIDSMDLSATQYVLLRPSTFSRSSPSKSLLSNSRQVGAVLSTLVSFQ